jgi:Putative regulator of cell autolysis
MQITDLLRTKNTDIFSNKSALIYTLRVSIPFNIVMLLGFMYSGTIRFWECILPITYMFFVSILLAYILFSINFYIVQKAWIPRKKLIVIVVGSNAVALILSVSFSNILFVMLPNISQWSLARYIMINMGKDLVFVMIVHISTLLAYLSKQQQEVAIEQERLITENLRVRYEILKNQINPHFIFNSLNTLDGLIGMDDESAHGYLQHFSSVFRYVINKKEVTLLSEELAFTESYAIMMGIRYGNNFRMECHIDEKYMDWHILPVSLQLLVENAIKHNVVSNNFPLLVTIETTPDDTIRVKNHINLKKEPEKGEGIGLANLSNRYRLLFGKEISITRTSVFCVEIPLIRTREPSK